MVAKSGTVAALNVRDFGARGDGSTDDTAALNAALMAAAEQGGALVRVPAGNYCISGPIDVPSNTHLEGEATRSTVLRVPRNPDFHLLRLHDVQNVTVSRLSMVETDHDYHALGNAIDITGQSQQILIDEVYAEGFTSAFTIGHSDDQQATIRNVTFRNCHGEYSRNWSFGINHAQQVLLDNCLAFRNRLDGIKLRRHARDVTIRGGESSHNGRTGPNGNGVDGYAGGDACVIENLLVEHNNGSGIYIKTGPLHYESYGAVRNGYISGVRARYNRSAGIDLNRSGGDLLKPGQDRLPPLISHFTISGGVFEHNETSGIYVRGRNVTILAPAVRRNQHHGIDLSSAWDVEVIGAMISGNSVSSPGSYDGIAIGADPVKGAGHRVKIRGGTIDGIDSDDITNGSDYSDFSSRPEATHRNAIHVAAGTNDVLIDNVTMRHWTNGPHAIRSDMVEDGRLLVYYGHVDGASAVGGPGSMLVCDGRLHVKTTPVSQTTGWVPIQPPTTGPSDEMPPDPVVGQMHFDTSRGIPLWYDGAGWKDAAGN